MVHSMDVAPELAERIAANPPQQLRMAERLFCSSTNLDLVEMLEISAFCQGACNQTGDHAEAVSALLEKLTSYFTSQ